VLKLLRREQGATLAGTGRATAFEQATRDRVTFYRTGKADCWPGLTGTARGDALYWHQRFKEGLQKMSLGPWQLIIIALVILVLFGRGRISEMMGDFGRGIKSFRKGMADEPDSPPPPQIPQQASASSESTTASGKTGSAKSGN
jgi:sec-independent protein translocase protein TatA